MYLQWHTVLASMDVQIQCFKSSGVCQEWSWEGPAINATVPSRYAVTSYATNTMVRIGNITLQDEGTYYCICDEERVSEFLRVAGKYLGIWGEGGRGRSKAIEQPTYRKVLIPPNFHHYLDQSILIKITSGVV